jgi:hypothetical protein
LCRHRLILRLRRGLLRHVFLEQRLEDNEDHERQNKDEKETALGAGFLLRILKVGQSLITVSNSWRERSRAGLRGLAFPGLQRRCYHRVVTGASKRVAAEDAG